MAENNPENKDIERRKSDEIERRSDRLVRRSLDYLKEFEEKGLANVEEPDLDGWDLHRAARENRVDIARALIDRGAEVDARNENGWTPLHWAAWDNSLEVARLLLDRGAEIDARNELGNTPLYWATWGNSLDVARLLIERGANTDGIDLSWMDDQEDA